MVVSRSWHGWDILCVFPIRGNKLNAADAPLSQKNLRAIFCQKVSDTTLGKFGDDGLYLSVLPIGDINLLAAVDDALSQKILG